jgi:hypothetical protein
LNESKSHAGILVSGFLLESDGIFSGYDIVAVLLFTVAARRVVVKYM